MIISLIVLALLAVLDLVAALGVRGDFLSAHTGNGWILPAVVYAAAALSLAACAWFRWHGTTTSTRVFLVVGLVLTMTAPLLYSHAIGEFHLSHHAVRAAVVLVAGVLVWVL